MSFHMSFLLLLLLLLSVLQGPILGCSMMFAVWGNGYGFAHSVLPAYALVAVMAGVTYLLVAHVHTSWLLLSHTWI